MCTIDTTCFDECFLFHVIIEEIAFFVNLSLRRALLQPPCLRIV